MSGYLVPLRQGSSVREGGSKEMTKREIRRRSAHLPGKTCDCNVARVCKKKERQISFFSPEQKVGAERLLQFANSVAFCFLCHLAFFAEEQFAVSVQVSWDHLCNLGGV